jgi:hypothetical protein
MSLFSVSMWGSIAALIAMVVCFIWLARRKKFAKEEMTPEEAADFVQDGTVGDEGGIVIAKGFKGKAWGAGFSAEIETREVVEMVKAGKWSEAGPWLFGILGALGAFLFWPMFILELCGAEPVMNFLLTALFFVTAVRAAWPRK